MQTFSGGLDIVRQLRPITFAWKEGGTRDVGFGAEEVEEIEPLLVTRNAKGEIEGVKYKQITTVLVNAVREQQTQIAAQLRTVQQQQNLITEQQALLKQQQSLVISLKKLVCRNNRGAEVCKR